MKQLTNHLHPAEYCEILFCIFYYLKEKIFSSCPEETSPRKSAITILHQLVPGPFDGVLSICIWLNCSDQNLPKFYCFSLLNCSSPNMQIFGKWCVHSARNQLVSYPASFCRLCQVNHAPSFATESELDHQVKHEASLQTLRGILTT